MKNLVFPSTLVSVDSVLNKLHIQSSILFTEGQVTQLNYNISTEDLFRCAWTS